MRIVAPREGEIGAEVLDIDANDIDATDAAALRDAVYRHKLIVFRGQALDKPQYVAFARRLGRPQIYFQKHYHHPDHPEIFVSSNVPENGKKVGVAGTGQYWHTDYQFQPQPLPLTLVYPQVLPASKRETYYIDMAGVYERLPADLRRAGRRQAAVQEAKWRYKVTAEDIDRAVVDILSRIEQLVARGHPSRGDRASRHGAAAASTSAAASPPASRGCPTRRTWQFMPQLFDVHRAAGARPHAPLARRGHPLLGQPHPSPPSLQDAQGRVQLQLSHRRLRRPALLVGLRRHGRSRRSVSMALLSDTSRTSPHRRTDDLLARSSGRTSRTAAT